MLKTLFEKPSALTLARQSLEDAQRQLLQHQSQAEYHASMVRFYDQAIRRLQAYIKHEGDTQ